MRSEPAAKSRSESRLKREGSGSPVRSDFKMVPVRGAGTFDKTLLFLNLILKMALIIMF